jgi:uncharacterized protein YcfJ
MRFITGLSAAALTALALPAAAQITLFEHDGFRGRSVDIDRSVQDLGRSGFNDRASSAIVRGGRYEVCDDARFRGRCVVLRQGQYPSLGAMGLNDRVSSIRPVQRSARIEDRRYAPPPPVAYDYRRRGNERLSEAEVVGVRAVYGQARDRCWIERDRLQGDDKNAAAAIAGAIIGGILGHQVGGGSGQDLATIGGAIAGAAIGANINDRPQTTFTRDVRRCANVPRNSRPAYWDVTYRWRGEYRYVMMTRPPGPTITVNRRGEPRV